MVGEDGFVYELEGGLEEDIKAVARSIYGAHLPEYLREPWEGGRGKWYEDWLKEQLDMLVFSEICDDRARLEELKHMKQEVLLVFGIFGTAFRLLDHMGMHLRAQTLGQYELWPEDEELLAQLCEKFLRLKSKTAGQPRTPFGFRCEEEPAGE